MHNNNNVSVKSEGLSSFEQWVKSLVLCCYYAFPKGFTRIVTVYFLGEFFCFLLSCDFIMLDGKFYSVWFICSLSDSEFFFVKIFCFVKSDEQQSWEGGCNSFKVLQSFIYSFNFRNLILSLFIRLMCLNSTSFCCEGNLN